MGSRSVTCHPMQVNVPRLTPAMQAGTRFSYPRWMEGWVDLVDLIAPRPEVELVTLRSRVSVVIVGTAVGKLLTLGGVGIWWIVDIILLVLGELRPADDSNWVPYYWLPALIYLLNVECKSDYTASKMTSHCAGTVQMREESESGIRKWEEMWFKTTAEDGERGGQQWRVMEDCSTDERLYNRKRSVTDSGQTSTSNVQSSGSLSWHTKSCMDLRQNTSDHSIASLTSLSTVAQPGFPGCRPTNLETLWRLLSRCCLSPN